MVVGCVASFRILAGFDVTEAFECLIDRVKSETREKSDIWREEMTFRFWCRIRLAPGFTLNLSKSTASLSLGPRGAKYTICPRGNRATAGTPGTGLFYTVHDRKRSGGGRDDSMPAAQVLGFKEKRLS